jgi:NAD dependent epimerase/dehydratase family enzyme
LAGGMANEMLLASQRAMPRAALSHGYRFAHGDLLTTLASC